MHRYTCTYFVISEPRHSISYKMTWHYLKSLTNLYVFDVRLKTLWILAQRAHDITTTSAQRRCNVDVADVEPTLYKRHVPAGWLSTYCPAKTDQTARMRKPHCLSRAHMPVGNAVPWFIIVIKIRSAVTSFRKIQMEILKKGQNH